jgi:pimeloyl-ACP methyl ester carboxylesterase
MTTEVATTSEDVTFVAGGVSVPGTIVHPTTPGRYPAVVLLAGSGPTDRDWNSPLLPAKNGSGKLLAEALAHHGAVVLRFDKAGVGGNKRNLTGATFDVYVDEGRAALALLRARPDVDPAHVYVAGHSEGGIHAIRVALAEGNQLAGVILLSSAGRTMKDIVLGQIEPQLRTAMPGQASTIMASLKQAFDDFLAGKPVDPTQVTTIPGLQNLLAAFVAPQTATLARGLVAFDPAPAVAQIAGPVFIYNGMKDVQVDPELDARRLADARKAAGKDVTLFLAPEANHMLKHETKTLGELHGDLAAVEKGYNADERALDDATVAAIVNWLAAH